MSRPPRPSAPSTGGTPKTILKPLSKFEFGVESDAFVLLTVKDRARTKDGKPFYKVVFRDRNREVSTPIWSDAPFFEECEKDWRLGAFYKIRAVLRDGGGYGPKLEIRRIRETDPGDAEDGFDPNLCRPSSDVAPEALAAELLAIAGARLGKGPLFQMVRRLFKERRDKLLETPASRSHHRAYVGGLLEHTLSVVKLAIALTDHFCAVDPALKRTLSKPLIVAGAIWHDLGKIIETETIAGATFRHTVEGDLIGHSILSRDLVREYAAKAALDDETRVELEHLVLTHSRFADWGAPTPPATLEAAILHYADYADSTFFASLATLAADDGPGPFATRKSPFGTPMLKPTSKPTPKSPPQQPPPKPPTPPRDPEPRPIAEESRDADQTVRQTD